MPPTDQLEAPPSDVVTADEGTPADAATTPLADVPSERNRTLKPTPVPPPRHDDQPKTLFDKVEAFISKLSVRDNFWHSICSLIWLPLAFYSGIKMKQIDTTTFAAYLPFRRFNRNWYRAMAGGALLANSEIAGGMYVFATCGGDYTVVCKNLNYTFLRPCLGPAVYRMTPRENIKEHLAHGGEFNITLDLEIQQQAFKQNERDRRVGKCEVTFHVTPKLHHKKKAARKAAK